MPPLIRIRRCFKWVRWSLLLLLACLVPVSAQAGLWVTGYYPGWESSTMPPTNIDFTTLTHVILFALYPQTNGVLNSNINSVAGPVGPELVSLAHAAGKKVLIGVGGADTEAAFLTNTTPANLGTFVTSIVNYMSGTGYDGVDLDWEPFNPATDTAQYTNLVIALRTAFNGFGSYKMLTVAVPAVTGLASTAPCTMLASIQSQIDQINILTYDLSAPLGGWVTWFNSPVYDGGYTFPSNPSELVPSINGAVTNYIGSGVLPAKLGIGQPFNGYLWTGGPGVTGPRQGWPSTNPPTAAADVPYNQIITEYYQSNLYHWDTVAQAAYLSITNTPASNDMFISYDDTYACQAKVSYASNMNLGGLMIYELAEDYFPSQPAGQRSPLVAALAQALAQLTVTNGAVLWLKADAGVTTNAAGQVLSWQDQTTNGNNAAQFFSQAITLPLLVTNAVNGEPAMYFDGTNDVLYIPNTPSLQPGTATNNWTVFFVGQNLANSTGDYPQIIGSRPWTTGVDEGWAVCFQNSPGTELVCSHFADGSSGYDVGSGELSQSPFSESSFQMWEVDQSAPQGILNYYLTGQVNGNYGPSEPTSPILQTQNVYIGGDVNGANDRRAQMYLSEVIIYNRILSATERQAVSGYLSGKYGLGYMPSYPPAVSLTSPTNGASLASPASFTMSATVTPGINPIQKVDFYVNNIDVATATAPPYSTVVSIQSPGTFPLKAVVTDTAGETGTSDPASITVTGTEPTPPLSVSNGLALWLDANQGITISSGGVSDWADQSTNGNNAAQFLDPSFEPTMTSASNGLQLVDFNGTSDWLDIANSSSLQPQNNNWTVLFVARQAGPSKGDFPEIIGSRPWETPDDLGWAVCFSTSLAGPEASVPTGVVCSHFADGTAGHDVTTTYSTSLLSASSLQLWQVEEDRSTAVTTFYLDGQMNATVASEMPAGPINQSDDIYIGSDVEGSGNRFANMDIGEILVFNRVLSPIERSSVNAYLEGKWGLLEIGTDNLPPTVTLAGVTNGAVLTAPATVNLTATAASPNGSIVQVQFFAGTVSLGTVTNSPYTISADFGLAGNETLTAVATDNLGNQTTSGPINFTVSVIPSISTASLINVIDYSDTFTINSVRTDGLYDNNANGAYGVESNYSNPPATWTPFTDFSFNTPQSSTEPDTLDAALNDAGAGTGLVQFGTGGPTFWSGDTTFTYGLRSSYLVQFQAILPAVNSNNRLDIDSLPAAGGGTGTAGGLMVFFRRPGSGAPQISLYNTAAGETAVTNQSGAVIVNGINDNNWHSFGVYFNQPAKQLQIYVDGVLLVTVNLATFDGGAYQSYSNGAVGMGGEEFDTGLFWADNFQVGSLNSNFTEISVTNSLNPSTYGSPVTLTATVTGTGTTPTGTIIFYDGPTILGTNSLTAGVATVTTTGLPVGSSQTITAVYSGDGNYAGNVNTLLGGQTVNPKALTITGLTVPSSKPYDGTTTAVVSGTPELLTAEALGSGSAADGKPYTGDAVSITGAATGTYNSDLPASATTVTFGGLSLTGAQAGDYSLTAGTASATITGRAVTLSGTYNGTTTMAGGNLFIGNVVPGDNLTLSGIAPLASANVGSEAISAVSEPSLVQSATGNTGATAAATVSATLGAAPANGNTLVAVISTRGTALSQVGSITQTGATWSRVAQAANTSSEGTTTEIWYAPNVSSAGTGVTINLASSLFASAVVAEYSGVLSASALDQIASNTGNGTAPDTGTTAATTQAYELWIGGIGLANSGYTLGTPNNSFTSVASAASTGATGQNSEVYALQKIASAIGTADSGGTVSGTAIAQRGSATSATTTSTTLTINKPTGVVAGDVMLVNISQTGSASSSEAVPILTGWTSVEGADMKTTSPFNYGSVLYKVATASEGTSYAFTLHTGVTAAVGTIVAFSGVDTSGATPFDVAPMAISAKTSASSSVAATTITTVTANDAVIMFGMSAAGSASTPTWSSWKTATSPGTLTSLYANWEFGSSTTDASVGAAWALMPTAGVTGAGAATLGTSEVNGGLLIALKPASQQWSGAVATFKAVSTPLALGGTSAAAYTLAGVTTVTVTPKALTMSGLTVPSSRSYNGTTTAMVSGTPILATAETAGTGTTNDGKPYSSDTVNITGTATGTYNSPAVASATTVTFGGLSLAGTQAGDYSLTIQSPASATITQAGLSITANSQSKTYGTLLTFGSGSTSFTSSGLQNGESIGSVTLTCSGGSANAAVGPYTITPSAATGGTFNSANYNIGYNPGTLTVILPSLAASLQNGNIVITWTGTGGTLQSSPTVNGPWTSLTNAVSPYSAAATATAAFYRLQN